MPPPPFRLRDVVVTPPPPPPATSVRGDPPAGRPPLGDTDRPTGALPAARVLVGEPRCLHGRAAAQGAPQHDRERTGFAGRRPEPVVLGSSNVPAGAEPAAPALGWFRPQRCPDPLRGSVSSMRPWPRNRTRAPKEGVMDLNVVAVTGRLAADPELRFTFNGTKVGSLRVAITRMKRKGEDRAGAD